MNLQKEKWKVTNLADVCNKVDAVDRRKRVGTFCYVDIGSINSELNRINEIQEIDWDDASSRAKQIIQKNDTLFSTVRVNLKRVALVENEIPNGGIASTGFAVLRAKESTIHPLFLFYNAINPNFLDKLIKLQVGTAYPAVTEKMVFNQEIPLPPLDEQERIVELFQSIERAILQAEGQEKNLLALKNQLLRDLFGEIGQFGNYLSAKDFEQAKFEKIALNISERVEPKQTDLEIYVGLEHLDSDDLVIRRKGKPEDVIGTKLKIFKGDIIFGKRRAYLRKVAVADFEGIVSAHSMVLRANEENIEKDFLPYFMQSDEFMNRAVQISEGSLSPTIKWKTLAQQEFILPKREKQAKLIDMFKQFDEARELIRQQKETLKKLKQKLLNEILG